MVLANKSIMWTFGSIEEHSNEQYNTKNTDPNTLALEFEVLSHKSGAVFFLKNVGNDAIEIPSIIEAAKSSSNFIIHSSLDNRQSEDAMGSSFSSQIEQSNLFKSAKTVTLKDFISIANGHNTLFSANMFESYIVIVDKIQNLDINTFQKISKLATITGSSASFLVLQEPGSVSTLRTPSDYKRILSASSTTSINKLLYKPEGSEYSIYYGDTYLYITPDIFTGLLTGIFCFFVLLIGFSCLSAIQGPSTFSSKNPPIGREA